MTRNILTNLIGPGHSKIDFGSLGSNSYDTVKFQPSLNILQCDQNYANKNPGQLK